MPDRRDALIAAAQLVSAVEQAARDSGSRDSVATTGVLNVYPGAMNSIPSRCYLEIDVRDIELHRRDVVLEQIQRDATEIADARDLDVDVDLINADPPAACDPLVVAAIEAAAQAVQLDYQKMVSRAYHDALFMAQLCPTAMIFIPCRDGVSHRPDEFASSEAIVDGVNVLARTLMELSAS